MKLIAKKHLSGSYGTVVPGQTFECEKQTALELIKNGYAGMAIKPVVQYETKVVTAGVTVTAQESFRPSSDNVRMRNEEPAQVATEGDSVLPAPVLPEQGTPNPRGRGRRSRV